MFCGIHDRAQTQTMANNIQKRIQGNIRTLLVSEVTGVTFSDPESVPFQKLQIRNWNFL